jgi:hypothetical protein
MTVRKYKQREPIHLPPCALFQKDKELAWQGAFMDGEGTITVSCQIRKDRPSPSYRAYISANNTNQNLIAPFVTMWGGNVYRTVDARTEKRWSDSFDWYCPQLQAAAFLTAIMPYLRGKRRQAELVLKFIAYKGTFKREFTGKGGKNALRGSKPLGRQEITFRESLKREIQMLNAKSKVYRLSLKGGDAHVTH